MGCSTRSRSGRTRGSPPVGCSTGNHLAAQSRSRPAGCWRGDHPAAPTDNRSAERPGNRPGRTTDPPGSGRRGIARIRSGHTQAGHRPAARHSRPPARSGMPATTRRSAAHPDSTGPMPAEPAHPSVGRRASRHCRSPACGRRRQQCPWTSRLPRPTTRPRRAWNPQASRRRRCHPRRGWPARCCLRSRSSPGRTRRWSTCPSPS